MPEHPVLSACRQAVYRKSVALDHPIRDTERLMEAISTVHDKLQEGTKNDKEKNRLELLAPEFLMGIGRVLTFGAKKYEDRNWEKGIRYGRVFGALLRHLWTWWSGESIDSETEQSHLYHAGCCLMFLSTYEARGMTDFDDRPPTPTTPSQSSRPCLSDVQGQQYPGGLDCPGQ